MRDPRISVLSRSPVRIVAATAAALVVCALHYVWRAPDRELARYLAEMEAAGKPTGMSDTALRPLPESQNAATLYMEAGAIVRAESVPDYGRVDWGLPARMDELRAGVARDRHALDLLHLAAEREGCRFEVSGGVAAQASAESPAWAWTLGGFVVDAAVVAADADDVFGLVLFQCLAESAEGVCLVAEEQRHVAGDKMGKQFRFLTRRRYHNHSVETDRIGHAADHPFQDRPPAQLPRGVVAETRLVETRLNDA